jgi:hypothetical protein
MYEYDINFDPVVRMDFHLREHFHVARSSKQAPFISEIVRSILATYTCERSAESREFSPRELPFTPTGRVDRVTINIV